MPPHCAEVEVLSCISTFKELFDFDDVRVQDDPCDDLECSHSAPAGVEERRKSLRGCVCFDDDGLVE